MRPKRAMPASGPTVAKRAIQRQGLSEKAADELIRENKLDPGARYERMRIMWLYDDRHRDHELHKTISEGDAAPARTIMEAHLSEVKSMIASRLGVSQRGSRDEPPPASALMMLRSPFVRARWQGATDVLE